MADEQTVRVLRPDGQYSTIPMSSLTDAIKRGYKPAPMQNKKTPFALATGIEPTPGGVAGYEEKELLGGGWDAIKGLFEMGAPPKTKLEGAIPPPFLPAKRLVEGMVEPLTHIGEVPGAIHDLRTSGVGMPSLALQVPRTMGNLATMYEMGRIAQPGYESMAGKAVKTPTRIGAQELAGAGREPVLQARMTYQDALRKYTAAAAEKKAEYAQKLADARRDWVQKAMEAKRGQAEAAKATARKETLARGQGEYAERLRQNLQKTFQTTKSQLDSRWHGLRSTQIRRGGSLTTLKDEPLNSKAIADTVEKAEEKYLQGAPESLKQFRDLMGWMRKETVTGVPSSVAEEAGGMKPELRPISWDEARTHYSALGDRMFSGDLPANVYNALRFVRDEGLGAELKTGAQRGGVLPKYESLLHDWSNFEHDWKDTSSVTRGGGSPLAVALKAPNTATMTRLATGMTGDLLAQRLGRYTEQGGAPSLAQAIWKLDGDIKSIKPGMMKPPSSLDPFKPPTPPKLGEPPAPPDPIAIRRGKLLEAAARPPSWFDMLFPPRGIEHLALKFPVIREWVATQPRNETPLPPLRTPEAFQRPARPSPSGPWGTPPPEGTAAGGLSALDASRAQRILVDNLKSKVEKMKASGAWDYHLVSQLRGAEEKLASMTDALAKAEWASKKAAAPQTLTPNAQGGLNYSAADLAAWKKKWGTPEVQP